VQPGLPFKIDPRLEASSFLLTLRGRFLEYRGSWAPLRPTYLLENLPLQSTEFYKKLGAKVMKKKLNYLSSKRWERDGRQELRSTPYKQEIDPRLTGMENQFLFWKHFFLESKTRKTEVVKFHLISGEPGASFTMLT
jgi:hypothetical protein